jgi:polar amino acid transport system permease protein
MPYLLINFNARETWKEFRPHILTAVLLAIVGIAQLTISFLSSLFQFVFGIFYSDKVAEQLAAGLIGTIGISFVAICIGTVAGFFIAYALRAIDRRSQRSKFIKGIRFSSWIIMYAALAMPAYLLIYWGYYFVIPHPNAWWVATGALALNLAAFVAKIVYSAFRTIPTGQMEVARTAGASNAQLIVGFEIPAVLRVAGSALAVEWATTLKLSSLVGVIPTYDILKVAINGSSLSYDQSIYFVVPIVYFVLVAPIILWSDHLKSVS